MIRSFWLDYENDRTSASDRVSRYGAYIRQHRKSFEEIWHDDPTAEFAAIAWRIANSPIMAPGFVQHHRRVRSAVLQRSEWNGALTADVELISESPKALFSARTPEGHYYNDWPTNYSGDYEGFGDRELAEGRSYLVTTSRVLFQLPAGLPSLARVPGYDEGLFAGGELWREAVVYLEAVVEVLNERIDPLINDLEHS